MAVDGAVTGALLAALKEKRTQVAAVRPAPVPRPSLPVKPAIGIFPKTHEPGDTFKDCADCPEMVVIPPGSFRMGDLNGGGFGEEKPVHDVRIGYSFAVGKYEVTQAEWRSVMGDNPSKFKGDRNPVEKVSWEDAQEFLRKLSAKTGKAYRLLSEAEWEYAARAGSTTKYPWGNSASHEKANYGKGKGEGLASGRDRWVNTSPVGSFETNAFGLHDMAGNVVEWVEDCWNKTYSGAPGNGDAWATGDCSRRGARGGSWFFTPGGMRSAYRLRAYSDDRLDFFGFRIARNLEPEKSTAASAASTQVAAVRPAPVPRPSLPVKPAIGIFPETYKPGDTFKDCADCPEMVVIPPGSFRMGDMVGSGDEDEKPVHTVTIRKPIAIGKFEVTQNEWRSIMGSNPSFFKGGRNPVGDISWQDAKQYVGKLSEKTGKQYRLLSEAEWEYMARAGSSTKYPWGDELGSGKAVCNGCGSRWDNKRSAPVGSFQPNAFGVYDTVGNVWEWVEDCWNENYKGAPNNGEPWTGGNCSKRVLRSGDHDSDPREVRSINRNRDASDNEYYLYGVRVARTLSP